MTTTRTVRDDQHGTAAGYYYGCRCDECRAAKAKAAGHHAQGECAMPRGRGSVCAQIAAQIIETRAEVSRLARVANKSPRHFAKYEAELLQAKQYRADAIARRDEHMAECPGAADRFGVSA